MPSDQSTSLTIEVLPNQDEFERAIEAITGDSSEPVPEERLRSEIRANYCTLPKSSDGIEQVVLIAEAEEKGLLNRDDEGLLRLNDSDHITPISETRIR